MRPTIRSVPSRRPLPSGRRQTRAHHLAAGFSGESVGNPLLQAVADLDPDAPFLHREQNQTPLSLALSPMPRPRFSNILTASGRRSRRLDGRNGRDDDRIAGLRLKRAAHAIDLRRARAVDDTGEIVDRSRQFRQGGSAANTKGAKARHTPDEGRLRLWRFGEPRRSPLTARASEGGMAGGDGSRDELS
jgi:hypothetical protein